MSIKESEKLIEILESSGNYRVLKHFSKVYQYPLPETKQDYRQKKFTGLFIDTETTGLDYKKDKIIEIALIPFEYSEDGRILAVEEGYNAFQDPGFPLDEQITALTGITNEMLKGQVIDKALLDKIVTSANLIVAHNSGFDRKFVEEQFPIFTQKPWGCSYVHVPWSKENIASAKLEYLAYKFGFFYEAHRATMDCLVAIHLLTQLLPSSGDLVFKKLLDNARKKSYRIWAESAPFAVKDILKERGYRWSDGNNGRFRSWYIEVDEENKQAELEFLEEIIYKKKTSLPIDEIDAFNRFSVR